MKRDNSAFSNWVRNMWYEHVEEYQAWNKCSPTDANAQEYFRRYKYWLKREYRHQQQQDRDNK